MKVVIEDVRCLGSEIKTSKKGNPYIASLFQKGIETIQLMLPDNTNAEDEKRYDLICDYSTRWKSMTLKELVPRE